MGDVKGQHPGFIHGVTCGGLISCPAKASWSVIASTSRRAWAVALVVATVLIFLCTMPEMAGASTSAVWQTTPISLAPNETGALIKGISCASSSFCIAVGYASATIPPGGVAAPLAELWDGSSWSPMATPGVPSGSMFMGVSCGSARFCVAVGSAPVEGAPGYEATATLLETWNGSAWSVGGSATPFGGAGVLDGVSCASPSFCVAVGYSEDGSGGGTLSLAETWNGSSWSITPTPDPATGSGAVNELLGVSCPSSSFCMAVGDDGSASGPVNSTYAFAAIYQAGRWSSPAVPNAQTGIGSTNELSAVSCPTPVWCLAIGFSAPEGTDGAGSGELGGTTEIWGGSSWSIAPMLAPSGVLTSVSCPAAESCLVSIGAASIAELQGSSWSYLAIPGVPSSANLRTVSCAGPGSCAAAGDYMPNPYSDSDYGPIAAVEASAPPSAPPGGSGTSPGGSGTSPGGSTSPGSCPTNCAVVPRAKACPSGSTCSTAYGIAGKPACKQASCTAKRAGACQGGSCVALSASRSAHRAVGSITSHASHGFWYTVAHSYLPWILLVLVLLALFLGYRRLNRRKALRSQPG